MKKNGFTLIELVITVAILSFGIIGVYGAFSPMVSLHSAITSRFIASYLAQEGFEVVRNIRDNNVAKIRQGQRLSWSAGLLNCSLGCQADYKTGTLIQAQENALKTYNENDYLKIADGFYGYDNGVDAIFKRKITITQTSNADVLKVSVIVAWNNNGKELNFETKGYLYNYQ